MLSLSIESLTSVVVSPPSRFVSDHSPAGCQALLQHRLIQANQKTQLGSGSAPEAARTYPLSLLEWTANRKKANMVLHVHCFDGETHLACFNLYFYLLYFFKINTMPVVCLP